jgi:hypothetical protein
MDGDGANLPPEVWLLTLSYLPTQALLTVATTSHGMRVLARDWSLWRHRWVESARVPYGKSEVRCVGHPTWRRKSTMHTWWLEKHILYGGAVEAVSASADDIADLRPRLHEIDPDERNAVFRRFLNGCRHVVLDGYLTARYCQRLLPWSWPCIFPNVERLVCAVQNTNDGTLRDVAATLQRAFPSPRLSVTLLVRPRGGSLASKLEALAPVRAITSLEFYSGVGVEPHRLEGVLASLSNVTSLTFTALSIAKSWYAEPDDAAASIEGYGRVLLSAPHLKTVTVVAAQPNRKSNLPSLHADEWGDVARRYLMPRGIAFQFRVVSLDTL